METSEAVLSALGTIGFIDQGATRRGGRQWTLEYNRFLTFALHHFGDEAFILTWSFELGEFFLERDMQIGAGETSFQELYPTHDVRLPLELDAVTAEIGRVLGRLRLDLADPGL